MTNTTTAPDLFALSGYLDNIGSLDALIRAQNQAGDDTTAAETEAFAFRDAGDQDAEDEARERMAQQEQRSLDLIEKISTFEPKTVPEAAQLLIASLDFSLCRDECDHIDRASYGAFERAVAAIERLGGMQRIR